MYEGYLEVSGVEILNAERTEAYVRNVGDGVSLRSTFDTDKIHLATGEQEYRSPLIDDAPWVNPLDLSSTDFLGLYPLDIEGLDESTMGAEVIEHLDDGGSFGAQRDASRAVRVHAVIVASSHQGAEYGLSWLGDAVRASECSMLTSCGAGDMVYFASEPDVCEGVFGEEQPDPDTVSFGSMPEPGLISYRFPSDVTPKLMPARTVWSASYAEGTRFVFGAMQPRGAGVLQESPVIAPIRRNYLPQPKMQSLSPYWTAGPGVSLVWAGGDGAVGGGYAHVDLKVDGFGVAPFGDSPFGSGTSDAYVDSYLRVDFSTTPMPAGPATFSIYGRGEGAPITLALIDDATGGIVSATTVTSYGDWERIVLRADLPTAAAVHLQVGGGLPFDFDAAMAEVGADVLDYFDGDTSTADYRGSWDMGPYAGPSSAVWLGSTEIVRPDSRWRPFFRLTAGTVQNLQLQRWRRNEISVEEQLLPYQRTLHDVQCTQGPQVIKRYPTPAGYFIEVDLVFVAGDPHPYSNPVPIPTFPLAAAPYDDPDVAPELDDAWLADPDSVAVTAPPRAPVILDTSVQQFSSWQRYYVRIPADAVRLWGSSVPTIGITTKGVAVKQVRVRFHPNPFDYPVDDVDPLNYCSEFVISYLPAAARLVVDGLTRSSRASKGGKATVTADHLLFGGADGAPITWPELTCGIPYVMTIDVPTTAAKDLFDIDLVMRGRG